MHELNNGENLGNQMATARLAKMLWKQAGSPPGGYKEFWMKIAASDAAARAAMEEDSFATGCAGSSVKTRQ